jgi:hypothetical protein
MVTDYAGWTWVCWQRFCREQPVKLLKRIDTDSIPDYDEWRLHDATLSIDLGDAAEIDIKQTA